MATIHFVPTVQTIYSNQVVPVNQTPITMPNGERFPMMHNLTVHLPQTLVQPNSAELQSWVGSHCPVHLPGVRIHEIFWKASIITDWIEENLEGRVLIHPASTQYVNHMGDWTITFSKRGQGEKLNLWWAARQNDTVVPITVGSKEQYEDILDWCEDHEGAVYLGGNLPGTQTNYPTKLRVDSKEMAFASHMRFGGKGVHVPA